MSAAGREALAGGPVTVLGSPTAPAGPEARAGVAAARRHQSLCVLRALGAGTALAGALAGALVGALAGTLLGSLAKPVAVAVDGPRGAPGRARRAPKPLR